MHPTAIIAFIAPDEPDFICPKCSTVDERSILDAFFGDDEADAPHHCRRCGDLIPHNLTDEGAAYVENAIRVYLGDFEGESKGDRATLSEWLTAYRDRLPRELAARALGGAGVRSLNHHHQPPPKGKP